MDFEKDSIVIIGGGLAGAAAGYHLARRGARRLILLEKEPTCGYHASGRNAAMIRQVVADEAVGSFARDGASFFKRPPTDWDVPFCFEQQGSVLLGAGPSWTILQDQAAAARARGVPAESYTPDRLRRWLPLLDAADFEGGIFCATDGVVDLQALLEGYLNGIRRAGGRIRTHEAVRDIETRGGRVTAVVTGTDRIPADAVVNAAGAWAGEVGRMAGATVLPLRSCRRHLFSTGPAPGIDRRWPFVWDVTHEFYFRPEEDHLLMSPCDEQEWPPGDPPTDAAAQAVLAEKLSRYAPRLTSFPILSGRAGLRILTPDSRFVIGADPRIEGFFWAAGLGGHGVTTGYAVGAHLARLITNGAAAPDGAAAFSPARFVR
jgi:D-arginine dehydrogenase